MGLKSHLTSSHLDNLLIIKMSIIFSGLINPLNMMDIEITSGWIVANWEWSKGFLGFGWFIWGISILLYFVYKGIFSVSSSVVFPFSLSMTLNQLCWWNDSQHSLFSLKVPPCPTANRLLHPNFLLLLFCLLELWWLFCMC